MQNNLLPNKFDYAENLANQGFFGQTIPSKILLFLILNKVYNYKHN
jgi:hypothetical protein